MNTLIQIHPTDTVAVALQPLPAGDRVQVGIHTLTLRQDLPAGHKVALTDHAQGDPVRKYGYPIGVASKPIPTGDHVHSHNLRTGLGDVHEYTYTPSDATPTRSPEAMPTFEGYRRADGRVGTRNEVWILNTVGCVNRSADRIARLCADRFAGRADSFHAFAHPFGCSQLGDDLQYTQRVLAGLVRNPNAGGVLLLGLGCENNQLPALLTQVGDYDPARVRHFNAQEVEDELEAGVDAVEAILDAMADDHRETCPASDLVLGVKCGGSDGFSGISANPLVGRVADRLCGFGGRALLTEVPEMFGAEQVLMRRAASETVFADIGAMVNDFKQYFIRHGQPIYENPSPGNKDGGLTTLEEKSLGAIQKGGHAPVKQVLRYGEPLRADAGLGGLSLLEAPGNDGVSSTAMVASGATVLLFTTGRGTPLGFPVPTLKIATNTDLATRKPHWIDFDAGALLNGTTSPEALTDALFTKILQVASGEPTRNELNDYREIAIWKEGVTL